MLNIKMLILGDIEANCYFVTNDEFSLVIDPGAPSDELEKLINDFGADKFKYILLTHGHFDHIGNVKALKKKYPKVTIVISEKDSKFTENANLNLSLFFGDVCDTFKADMEVSDEDKLDFGNDTIRVLLTPGHTQGSVCYLIGNSLFTGDTLFSGTVGRMDFPTGSESDMMKSIKRLSELPGNPDIYCGHNAPTTLEREKKNNYMMRKL